MIILGSGAHRAAHRSSSSMLASLREEPESPPSPSLTHTYPYSIHSESSCSSFSCSICTYSSELCCCVPVALGALLQSLHLQPGPHFLSFLTQLQRRVLHTVTLEHEQLWNNRPSWCFTASPFSTNSQSNSSFLYTIFQPYWVRSSNLMWLLAAWFHMLETQQVCCQWHHRASNDEGNSSSNSILLHTLCNSFVLH